MAQHQAAALPDQRLKPRKRPANIHMYWPQSLRNRIDEITHLRAIRMSELVIRVLSHADAEGMIERWISTPPPTPPNTGNDSTG